MDIFEVSDILKAASSASRSEILSFAFFKRYEKGQHVFFDREENRSLYILAEGMASLYKLNSLGEKKVIFAFGPGNLLNEVMFQALPASISCEVREDSLVMVMPRDRFLYVMEKDRSLNRAVMDAMALRIRRLYRQLKNTTNALSGEKRLAAKLFKLARDNGVKTERGVLIDMSLSITYLADMLGSKRETVSRQVKRLTELKLICMEKNRIFVPDIAELINYFKQP